MNRNNSLNPRHEPIFKPIFGDQWSGLPISLKKHYANHPYSLDVTIVEGKLDIQYHWIMNVLRPFYRLLGNIPIERGSKIPVTVQFASTEDSKAFHFNRIFHFSHCKPYVFRSQMLQLTGNKVVEIMRLGLCWKTQYSFKNDKVLLKHDGYALSIFNKFIPLPLSWIVGQGNAEEIAINNNAFVMKMVITHPLFGDIYSYGGEFEVIKEAHD